MSVFYYSCDIIVARFEYQYWEASYQSANGIYYMRVHTTQKLINYEQAKLVICKESSTTSYMYI